MDPWVGKIPLEKEMATHASILARGVPWTEEPGGRQSLGSQSRNDLVTKEQQQNPQQHSEQVLSRGNAPGELVHGGEAARWRRCGAHACGRPARPSSGTGVVGVSSPCLMPPSFL